MSDMSYILAALLTISPLAMIHLAAEVATPGDESRSAADALLALACSIHVGRFDGTPGYCPSWIVEETIN